MDRVEERFGGKPPGQGMRKVNVVILVPLTGLDRMLVGTGCRDKTHDPAGIKARGDKIIGQALQQLRIRWRIAGADVIYRVDDSDPEEIAPQAIDEAAGKVRVLWRCDPIGNQGAPGALLRRRPFMLVGELRWSLHSIGVLHIAIFLVEDDLLAAPCGGEARVREVLGTRSVLSAYLREERRELPVIPLGPPLEGMVVALIAAEADAEKELGRVLHHRLGRTKNLVIGCRRILDRRPLGIQQGGHELVIGNVARYRTSNPGLQGPGPLASKPFLVDLEKVRPLVGPEINELRAADQAADQLVALRLRLPPIEKVGTDRLYIRDGAGEVEVDPAYELRIG